MNDVFLKFKKNYVCFNWNTIYFKWTVIKDTVLITISYQKCIPTEIFTKIKFLQWFALFKIKIEKRGMKTINLTWVTTSNLGQSFTIKPRHLFSYFIFNVDIFFGADKSVIDNHRSLQVTIKTEFPVRDLKKSNHPTYAPKSKNKSFPTFF